MTSLLDKAFNVIAGNMHVQYEVCAYIYKKIHKPLKMRNNPLMLLNKHSKCFDSEI